MSEALASQYLSLVIPTYNRADFLDESLRRHLPLLAKASISVHISDNASSDQTAFVVKKHQKNYPFLHYHCNTENLGADRNFEIALSLPKSKYIWLLGDTSTFDSDGFDKIVSLSQLKESFDVIILNDAGRAKNMSNGIISDRNILLRDLGWHMTQMSTLIYSSSLLKSANFRRYRDTNFIQTGIIFEYLAYQPDISVWCLPDVNIRGFKVEGIEKKGWQSETFEIWMRRWPNFVMSLPAIYDLENKQHTIKMHNRFAKVFSFSKLLRLRANGILTFRVVLKYLPVARQSVSFWTCFLTIFLSFIPKSIISFKR